jgi:Ni2+-binding GTPase involved in maturation of urease and hydrogenase
MTPPIEQRATGSLDEIGQQDHEVTSEYRIFGPPGTGKTTNLTRQIRRAVDRYGAESILVTSFSRGAAAELAGRDLPISADRVGTLHSHCWHALNGLNDRTMVPIRFISEAFGAVVSWDDNTKTVTINKP